MTSARIFNTTRNPPAAHFKFLPIKSYIMGVRSLLAGSPAWAIVATSAMLVGRGQFLRPRAMARGQVARTTRPCASRS